MKKTVKLENIDPVEIYGAGNRVLEALCGWFPQLRVIARGDEIILEGSESDCGKFAEKINQLIERRLHKRNLSPYDVEDLFDGEKTPDRFIPLGDSVIVHGLDGKPAAYMIVFSLCAVAYLVAWAIMKSLVPRYKKIEI